MADKYGAYYNNGSYDVFRAAIRYETTTTDTTVTVRCRSWIAMGDGHDSGSNFAGRAYVTDDYSSWVYGSGYLNAGDESGWLGDVTKTFSRGHSDQTVTCSGQGWSSTWDAYTPWVNAYVTVPKRASWKVNYNANQGSGAPAQQTKWYGESLTLSSTKPTRTGYTFKGWSTSSSATTATYQPGDPYTANTGSAVTLYAVWQAVTYKVTFNANGGSGAPSSQTKTHGVALTLNGWGSTSATDAPTRTGYGFLGWSASSSATSATYTSSSHSYTDNKAVTLYAVWKADTYQVAYNANGGSGTVQSQTKTYNVALTLRSNSFTRAGYAFKGWATSAKGSVAYAAGASYTANKAVTLYAVWQAQAPGLTVSRAYRAKSTGTADDEETNVRVVAKWTQAASGSVTIGASVTVGGTTYSAEPVTSSETSGTAYLLIGTDGTLDGGTAYTVTVTATNANGTTTKTYRLGSAAWPIDVLKGGTGIAMGKAATTNGLLDVAWAASFGGAVASAGRVSAMGGKGGLGGDGTWVYIGDGTTNKFALNKSDGNIRFHDGTSWKDIVYRATQSRTANTVLAAPDGSAGAASFRALVADDIPSLAASKIGSGTFASARIPTVTTSAKGAMTAAQNLKLAGVRHGSFSWTTTSSGYKKSQAITFGITYSSAPLVFLTMGFNWATNNEENARSACGITAVVAARTTTGATIHIWNEQLAAGYEVTVYWLAIGSQAAS